eukprot:2007754-Rhodomonas_salina.2
MGDGDVRGTCVKRYAEAWGGCTRCAGGDLRVCDDVGVHLRADFPRRGLPHLPPSRRVLVSWRKAGERQGEKRRAVVTGGCVEGGGEER